MPTTFYAFFCVVKWRIDDAASQKFVSGEIIKSGAWTIMLAFDFEMLSPGKNGFGNQFGGSRGGLKRGQATESGNSPVQ